MNALRQLPTVQGHVYSKQGGRLTIPPTQTFEDVCLLEERRELLARVQDLPERVETEATRVLALDNQPGQDQEPERAVVSVYQAGGLAARVDHSSPMGVVGIQHSPESAYYARHKPHQSRAVEYLIATRCGPQVEVLKYRDLGSNVYVSRQLGNVPENLSLRDWLLS